MVNIKELEKKWLYYKIKSYIPHAVIFMFILIMAAVFSIYKPSKVETIKATIQEKVTQTPIHEVQKEATKEKEAKVVMEPSLNFLSEISNSIDSQNPAQERSEQLLLFEPTEIQIMQEIEETLQEQPLPSSEVKSVINIKRKNDTQSDIVHVIERFKKSNSPALSLFIAKSYYELGDYNQAYNYALITNEIDNNIEASWIIFAKSLVKMGQKEKAIATLKEYVKHSKSSNAKTLLDEIVLGKVK